jgi:predicted transcriptional regulator
VKVLGKRAWVDIVAAIVLYSQEGENITDLMYKTRISYSQLREYLDLLLSDGLLRKDPKQKSFYVATKKGLEFLESYSEVRKMVFPNSSMIKK